MSEPDGFEGQLRPYQAKGRFVALFLRTVGARRVPSRRYGPGQNDRARLFALSQAGASAGRAGAASVPHFCPDQLAA